MLDRPYANTGKTVYEWMVERFREIEAMPPGSPTQTAAAEEMRARLHDFIRNTDPGPAFRQELKSAMDRVFGADFKGGVFVRSDTNVEDLPGFTGAGLNLTVPNVVGFDNVVGAIGEVWASPYTARAFAWRQSHMRDPENVYPAVLLLRTVPSEESGVMVTQSLETGRQQPSSPWPSTKGWGARWRDRPRNRCGSTPVTATFTCWPRPRRPGATHPCRKAE